MSNLFVRDNHQVDMLVETLVTGIQTQGDPMSDSWMTKFVISHSHDCENFERMLDRSGHATVSGRLLRSKMNRGVLPLMQLPRGITDEVPANAENNCDVVLY